MRSGTSRLVLATLLCLPPAGAASTLHRCEAPDGRITFTSLSCASDEQLSVQQVHPYSPGSVVPIMPEHNHEEISGMTIRGREPGIVGRMEDKCGNLIDARQRREAIINQRVIAGMSQRDVESALGKPDKVNIRTSTTSYRYDLKRGRSAQVDFDERGCVKGKTKSQTAKSPR
ncbi:cell envelope protein SmpA [Pseudomonas serboccidentalis]|uniref:Cell envelope protein SmpA n=1 Tax=Pseudomonas serboccidentalis TaxID=2964670 RepID=A0ABY7Z898_9PSED|nr:cell envelope protein SmpA [Pseudomonas serboccidentalis]WDR35252.1 cell envelope protein SmpA [Pseudomonas serboccidentalis]